MKYKIKIIREYESEVIEANNKKEAYEVFKKGEFKVELLSERLVSVSRIGYNRKIICRIPEYYYKNLTPENFKQKFKYLAEKVFHCLYHKSRHKKAYEYIGIFESKSFKVKELFDLIDEYVKLIPEEVKEKYLEIEALIERGKL